MECQAFSSIPTKVAQLWQSQRYSSWENTSFALALERDNSRGSREWLWPELFSNTCLRGEGLRIKVKTTSMGGTLFAQGSAPAGWRAGQLQKRTRAQEAKYQPHLCFLHSPLFLSFSVCTFWWLYNNDNSNNNSHSCYSTTPTMWVRHCSKEFSQIGNKRGTGV